MSKKFVKRVGTELFDIHDNPFLLRGVGIGGWLLFEGYMLQSMGNIDRPNRFKSLIKKSTNDLFYNYFFASWYHDFFTEDDIILLKNEDFNSIRIAIDYQFLYESSDHSVMLQAIENHYAILDRIINICKVHSIYVILDMHAAPGGQTGTNIDNSLNDIPELFTSKLYQKQLCFIWKDIASRYKDENIIAAYDLLNEPLPNWQSMYNHDLIPLYKAVIKEIRSVDPNHLITLEGLHWSTDWSCFTEVIDPNILLQFHKYWSAPERLSIKPYTDVRDNLDVPIFMGEGGENNLQWYYAVFKLYEQMNISYNFWTYKKMSTHNSIVSFSIPQLWQEFLKGELDEQQSISVLNELLENIKYRNCTYNLDVINHIQHKNSLTIPAYGFDYYGIGKSCYAKVIQDSSMRYEDGIKITNIDGDIIEPNFKQYGGEDYNLTNTLYIELTKDDWVHYTFKNNHDASRLQVSVEANSHNYKLLINEIPLENAKPFHLESLLSHTCVLKIIATGPVRIGVINVDYIN